MKMAGLRALLRLRFPCGSTSRYSIEGLEALFFAERHPYLVLYAGGHYNVGGVS